jgi:hypothetical protein
MILNVIVQFKDLLCGCSSLRVANRFALFAGARGFCALAFTFFLTLAGIRCALAGCCRGSCGLIFSLNRGD